MTPFEKYKQRLHKTVLAFAVPDQQLLQALLAWHSSTGFTDFIKAFEHETKLRLKNTTRTDKALVEQGFPKNINEYNGKTAWDQYYIANALMFVRQAEFILEPITPLQAGLPELFYRNIVGLARKLFLDSLVLLEDWATFKHQIPGVFGIAKARYERPLALFHSALQVIYGKCSPWAFAGNHSDTSINLLRMAIELRIRHCAGILAKTDKSGSIVPLPLSEIIEAIDAHKVAIAFPIPFEHIDRLYNWSNIYMHSGLKQYTWSPIFALTYLRPFLVGSPAVVARYGVIKQVQSMVEARINKQKYSLHVLDPANCDIKLKK